MILTSASRQILNASASLGTTARAAGVSIAAPDATKSFCMSTTIIAVLWGSITSMCIASLQIYQECMQAGRNLVRFHPLAIGFQNFSHFVDRVPTARGRCDAELFLDDCIRIKAAIFYSAPETDRRAS